MRDVPGCGVRVMSGKHRKTKTRWWRCVGRRHQEQKPRRLLTEMVDSTGLAHWVTHEAFDQGLRERTGHYLVLCGRRIAVAEHGYPTAAGLLELPAGPGGPGVLSERPRPQQVGEVAPTVAAHLSDRSYGSLACSAWASIAAGGGLIPGWPLVELAPTPVAPGGQPAPFLVLPP